MGKSRVPVGVGVREKTRLEHGVGGRLDTMDEMRRRERDLLDLREVVLYVLVEGDLADGAKRVVGVRPDLGQVENVVTELLGLLSRHGLLRNRLATPRRTRWKAKFRTYDVDSPRREPASLDILEQELSTVVGILASKLASLSVSESLEAAVLAKMNLDIMEFALAVHKLEGVTRVAVHVVEAFGSSTVREQGHDLVDRLRV